MNLFEELYRAGNTIIVKQKKSLHFKYENVNDKHTEYSRHR